MSVLDDMAIGADDKLTPNQFLKMFEDVIAFSVPEHEVDSFLSMLYTVLSQEE